MKTYWWQLLDEDSNEVGIDLPDTSSDDKSSIWEYKNIAQEKANETQEPVILYKNDGENIVKSWTFEPNN